jgi:hypothetical protein
MSANIPDTSNERQHLDVQGTPGHLPHRVPLIRSLISPAKFLARRGFQCSEHVETALHHHQQKTKKNRGPGVSPKAAPFKLSGWRLRRRRHPQLAGHAAFNFPIRIVRYAIRTFHQDTLFLRWINATVRPSRAIFSSAPHPHRPSRTPHLPPSVPGSLPAPPSWCHTSRSAAPGWASRSPTAPEAS